MSLYRTQLLLKVITIQETENFSKNMQVLLFSMLIVLHFLFSQEITK